MDCAFFDCALFDRYRVSLPYPDVEVGEANPGYAAILSGTFAGKGSETTAIAQYSAHRFFTQSYPEIYTAYKYIAFTEMTHFSLLGRLILRLGTNPKLFSYEDLRWWSGADPAYHCAIRPILESDIEGEHGAIAHYTRIIGQIPHEGIQSLLRRIIMDEERHVEVLTQFYEGV
jgi:bacterioferritin